jgi:predicted  nucleic acid-binding Zn-ribbon protein
VDLTATELFLHCRQQQAQEQPEVDAAQDEIDHIADEIAALNQQQANLRAEIADREADLKRIEDDLVWQKKRTKALVQKMTRQYFVFASFCIY